MEDTAQELVCLSLWGLQVVKDWSKRVRTSKVAATDSRSAQPQDIWHLLIWFSI